jgi:hypothetical protein
LIGKTAIPKAWHRKLRDIAAPIDDMAVADHASEGDQLPVNSVYCAVGADSSNRNKQCGHSGLIQINIPGEPPAYIDAKKCMANYACGKSRPLFAPANGIKCFRSVAQGVWLESVNRWQVH